ncbi:urea ABC transporter permease subunit UrtB [Bermanella marisrubri]|uniref:Branched-chain amino acid ABC-type transport system, permease components n=1 Tax=Bermanella marisrubri TaxID=207949 RepID=Q1MZ36_9GAMM|nr:urea ABC transporter permease subunit UrtB [Bermanella marisrubri]EAT11192.1 Branched-chain amino acid ABC-type transport system, permease components [Oceanobacter sp. RED65] [Bermanella marisrubri]QIZ85669.1 urea ABC transporter permease subunit UrtB [Bermanella marisrubri]
MKNIIACLGFWCALCLAQLTQANEATSVQALLKTLPEASYQEKENQINQIASLNDERVLPILQNLLEGELYYLRDSKAIVYSEKLSGRTYKATDAFTNETLGEFKRRDVRKIKINNNLRRVLNGHIAELQITSKNPDTRLSAANEMLKTGELENLSLIQKALETEKNINVLDALQTAQAIILLNSSDQAQRLTALKTLDRSLYPESRIALTQFLNRIEANPKQYTEAEKAMALKNLDSIDQLMELNSIAENIYFGLALGAVLLLAAIGLAITFGVMGVINMAHGEMIMLGAYTTFVIQQLMPNNIGMSLVVAIPAAFLVSGLVGVIIERTVIRHLYGRPLETLLATFGISLVLQQAVRSIFGPLNQDVITPDWLAGTFMVNPGLELTYNRLYIIIFSLMVLAGLALVLKKTLFGLQMRAVTMDRPMASSMGIKTGWVDALTFGLGSGIAGIAGVALSQLTNVGPNLGQAYIIDSFMVVVFGGVGNLWGTLVGAMSLGVANKMFEPLAGAVLAKIIVLVAIILFIQKRPRGLFALKGRAVEG